MSIDTDFHSHVVGSFQMVDELTQLAREAARIDVVLEIKEFDMCFYPEAVLYLAYACMLCGTPISIGTDAHHSELSAQRHIRPKCCCAR